MPNPTIKERLATVETQIAEGFKNINISFSNHLDSHSKIEKFRGKLILSLLGIVGVLSASLLTTILVIVFGK